ncbi:hypothetical protein LB542_15815 [Mesorhizobium sp. BR1-1-9]|uniref:ATP-dependent DNA ligase n=1 Tax=unclassified Mesorhizobium TaxID=325217 RepID=UPI001CD1931A|nr:MULTISPECIES: hypothetical protein [unclassified Mesorhizobium]MBZ9872319.1 hypothetical protein [Mesorhizobium sp. BR1-1-9]MBZ9944660.1 hypothetical protein [Mesorhizobium sp. BR1-1-13]
MEPELVDRPLEGDGWCHEIKFDGYRTEVIKDIDGIRFYTKNGFDWTDRYHELAREAASIEAESFIFEGEAIRIDEALHVAVHGIALRSEPLHNLYDHGAPAPFHFVQPCRRHDVVPASKKYRRNRACMLSGTYSA